MTLYEIWTKAAVPYKGMNNQRVWVEVNQGLRLSQPEGCSDAVYRLMSACWASESRNRPDAATLTQEFRQLYMAIAGSVPPAVSAVAKGSSSGPAAHGYLVPTASAWSAYSELPSSRSLRLAGEYAQVVRGKAESHASRTVGLDYQNPLFVRNGQGHIYHIGNDDFGNSSSTDDDGMTVSDLAEMHSRDSSSGYGTDLQLAPETKRMDPAGEQGRATTTAYASALTEAGAISQRPRGVLHLAWDGPVTMSDAVRDAASGASASLADSTPRVLHLAWVEPAEADDSLVASGAAGVPGKTNASVPGGLVGLRVRVEGYHCAGTLRFYGEHHERGTMRCGVELDEPYGSNDGKVDVRLGQGIGKGLRMRITGYGVTEHC